MVWAAVMGRLQSKIAMITGGASGIGAACARAFVREGAHVLVTDIQDQAGEALVAELGEAADYRHLDVTRREDWDAAVAALRERHGRLHVLVHNAGGGVVADIERCTLEQWREVQALNVESVFMGTQAALPLMRASEEPGSIVVVSSVAGLVGEPDLMAYGAAKAAVRLLSKSIALHCARRGDPIRCNSIHPSFTDTPMVRAMVGLSKDPDEALRRLAKTAPVGRLAEPEEIAAMVLYLASDESAFVTGAELVIDGGLTAM